MAERALRPGIVAALVGVTLAAWLLVLARMRGMDSGPGTDLGSAGWYLGIWATLMAAMMLPRRRRWCCSSRSFVGLVAGPGSRPALRDGYLIAWTAFGLVAFGIFRLVRGLDPAFSRGIGAGPEITGARSRSPASTS